MTYALNTANGAPATGLAAVLRRQRVLHRGRRVTSTAPARTTSSSGGASSQRVRPRHALLQRRPRAHLQRPRRRDLQRQHERGGRLLPRRRPHPPRRRLRDRHRAPAASTRRRATRTRSRSSTPSATRCGARRSTAPPAAAPRWPTSRATASSPSSRAPCTGATARSRPSTPPRARRSGTPTWARRRLRVGDHGRPHRKRLPGRHRAHGRRASSSSTARRVQSWPTSTTGPATPACPPGRSTDSRTPRWSRPTPMGRSASRWPGTSASPASSDVQGIVQHFEVDGLRGRPGRRSGQLAAVPPRRGA